MEQVFKVKNDEGKFWNHRTRNWTKHGQTYSKRAWADTQAKSFNEDGHSAKVVPFNLVEVETQGAN